MTDKMRSDFESEAKQHGIDLTVGDGGFYEDPSADWGWVFWQAATLAERERNSYYTTGVHGLVDKSKSDAIRQGGEG